MITFLGLAEADGICISSLQQCVVEGEDRIIHLEIMMTVRQDDWDGKVILAAHLVLENNVAACHTCHVWENVLQI